MNAYTVYFNSDSIFEYELTICVTSSILKIFLNSFPQFYQIEVRLAL